MHHKRWRFEHFQEQTQLAKLRFKFLEETDFKHYVKIGIVLSETCSSVVLQSSFFSDLNVFTFVWNKNLVSTKATSSKL